MKLRESDLKGNKNYFNLAGVSSYRGFELPRINYSKGNLGEIDSGSSQHKVRVSEVSSYLESTVVHSACSTLTAFCAEKYTSRGYCKPIR